MNRSPIAYIVFNRPQYTRQTFQVIREQQPPILFIIADGPRHGHVKDFRLCSEVREIVEQIDWPCEVHRKYADHNLGLKKNVSDGLDWVFDMVDRAIVIEDDCLPHMDFFYFCEELLERYSDNESVAVVTGNNFQDGYKRGDASYYFSKYNHCWGWATWRRAWKHYQGDIPFWPKWSKSEDWLARIPDPVERRYWSEIFDNVHTGGFNSWAYPWTASLWFQGGLTATPNVNLVSNIGFGADSTHTSSVKSPLAAMPVVQLGEIIHPKLIKLDAVADKYTFDHAFGGRSLRFPRSLIHLARQIVVFAYRMILFGRKS